MAPKVSLRHFALEKFSLSREKDQWRHWSSGKFASSVLMVELDVRQKEIIIGEKIDVQQPGWKVRYGFRTVKHFVLTRTYSPYWNETISLDM